MRNILKLTKATTCNGKTRQEGDHKEMKYSNLTRTQFSDLYTPVQSQHDLWRNESKQLISTS